MAIVYGVAVAVRAIIFDLDGTLIDSLEDIAGALDAALTDHGLPPPSRAAVQGWIGGGAHRLVGRALASLVEVGGARTPPPSIDAVLARFRAHYTAAPVVHTRVYEGLEPVLDRFAASHVTLAVLTNKPHDLAVRIADQLLARWPFVTVVGQRPGVPLKPDPEPALMLAEELGLRAEHCVYIGDSAIDIETARGAGMLPVGVAWGYRPREELVAAAPALLADQPADLRTLVA